MAISKININGVEHELETTINNVDGLQSALNEKASASDLTSHTGNTTVHVTATERSNWGGTLTLN